MRESLKVKRCLADRDEHTALILERSKIHLDACDRRKGIIVVSLNPPRSPVSVLAQYVSYALLHLGNVEFDMRLQLHVLIVGIMHLVLDVLL